jgi:hypothetical protein
MTVGLRKRERKKRFMSGILMNKKDKPGRRAASLPKDILS